MIEDFPISRDEAEQIRDGFNKERAELLATLLIITPIRSSDALSQHVKSHYSDAVP